MAGLLVREEHLGWGQLVNCEQWVSNKREESI